MPLFRRGMPGDREANAAAAREEAASLESLERGELPLRAQQRLAKLAGASLFTSDLTVNEFGLLHSIGVRPIGQVMGTSVFHVGWQQSPGSWGGWQPNGLSQELTVLSEAWNTARERAFGRLQQEAKLLGADAVVGVRLTKGSHDWAAGAIEYVAIGTAVRLQEADSSAQPVLTRLSGQDFRQLWQGGYRPIGVVGGSSVYYVVSGWQQQRAQQGLYSSWANQELRDFTQGVYDAREATLGRVSEEARRQGAAGMVGVSIEHSVAEREVDTGGARRTDLIVTMHVLGTAIAQHTDAIGAFVPSLRLDLSAETHPTHILGGSR